MLRTRVCGQCGAEVSGYSAEGLCPKCMLLGGLDVLAVGPLVAQTGSAPRPPQSETGTSNPNTGRLRYFGDYALLEEIARGGMGIVYKARQVSLNRIVAVKMIVAGQLANAEALQRFMAEAEAAANLHHPNIVAIYEVGEHDGQHYFSMEYVEGANLAAQVREKPLPAARAARYVRLIAEAIQYAHEQGTLHRDLKPSNVLLDSFDQPRITDFGLAKQVQADSDLTLSGQILGTPGFMPPEQAAGQRSAVGPASDVYSLGAILYHLMTGRPPFVAESMTETLRLVAEAEPMSPRLLNPSVPRDLETICLKCLEKPSAKRYSTAHALADELDRFLHDEPIQARPVSSIEKAWRWCGRKPLVAGLFVALAFSVAFGFLGIFAQWRRAETARREAVTNENNARIAANKSLQTARFLQDMLGSVRPSVALGRDPIMLREILDKTTARIDRDLKDLPEVEVSLRSTIGRTYLELGEYARAEGTLRQALRLNESVYDKGQSGEAVAECLNNLAIALYARDDFAGAEVFLRQQLALEQKTKGENSQGFISALSGLGLILEKRGDLAGAEQAGRQLLEILRRNHSDTNEDGATLLSNLAYVMMEQQDWSEAEALARRAVALDKQLFGKKHPNVVQSLGVVAEVLYRRGNVPAAETIFCESVAIGNEILEGIIDLELHFGGIIGVKLPSARHQLATERSGFSKFASQARNIDGETNSCRYRLVRLIDVLSQRDTFPEAEQMCRESLALAKEAYRNDPSKLENCSLRLQGILSVQGNYAEAEALARDVLKSRLARLPADSDEIVSARNELAIELANSAWAERVRTATVSVRYGANDSIPLAHSGASSAAARAREAETLLRVSLSARIKNLDPENPRVAFTKGLLGGALVSVVATDRSLNSGDHLTKLSEAESLLLEATDRLVTDNKMTGWWRRAPLDRMVHLYEDWSTFAPESGKGEKADVWKQQLAEFDRTALVKKPAEENQEE